MLQIIYIFFKKMKLNTSVYTLPHFTNKVMSQDTKKIWLKNDEVCFFFLVKQMGIFLYSELLMSSVWTFDHTSM